MPYKGCKETCKQLEVDVEGDRVYAATNNGIYVWELMSHLPVALLRTQEWTNTVRCYPPLPQQRVSAAASDASSTTHVVSGDEAGHLTLWDLKVLRPVTKLATCPGAITSSMYVPDPNDKTTGPGSRTALVAVSLTDAYIVGLTPASMRMELRRRLEHPSACTATAVLSSMYASYLMVGLESGAIICWSTDTWQHTETLAYPCGEEDVLRDKRVEPERLLLPTVEVGGRSVSGTFEYNKRRFGNPLNSGYVQHYTPQEEAAKYLVKVDTQLGIEVASGQRTVHTEGSVFASPSQLMYDRRRVTALASSTASPTHASTGGALSQRFFSGHATGEVIVWESSHRSQAFLLKVLPLFPNDTWVHLTALHVPLSAVTGNTAAQGAKLPNAGSGGTGREKDATGSSGGGGGSSMTVCQLMASGNNGQVFYLQTSKKRVHRVEGPGFAATAGQYICSRPLPNPSWKDDSNKKDKAHRHYVLLGDFQGRVERFDVSATVKKLYDLCAADKAD